MSFEAILQDSSADVRDLAVAAANLIRRTIPNAQEDVDESAKLVGFTYKPKTYQHLIAAVAVHKDYVNIMFAKGAELSGVDETGLLEGTGKLARHVKVRSPEVLRDPALVRLLTEAATRTPRPQ